MGIGTFGSFTQARLAIYASQTGLTVTGNNISNVNTKGYTRQRLDLRSLHSSGADRYYSSTDVRVGQGVLCTGVSQLRDPYLDIRYRSKMAEVGAMDVKLGGLEGIAQVLDEVGKGEIPQGKDFGIVAAQFEKVYEALKGITDQTGHSEYDVQIRSACEALAKQLNAYAAGLQELYDNTVSSYEKDVTEVNTILKNIRSLNESIREANIYGDNALELRDERNNLIDQLSEYMKINVDYTTEEIGLGVTVEKLIISLGNANPDASIHTDTSVLIDGIYGAQFSINPVLNPAAYQYVDEFGGLTNDPHKAAKVPERNPDSLLDPADPDYDGTNLWMDKDGNPTDVEADANLVLKQNDDFVEADFKDGLLYLKANGAKTASFDEAAHDSNFGLTISELRDARGRLDNIIQKFQEQLATEAEYQASGGKAVTVTDPVTGMISVTTFRKEVQPAVRRNSDWNGEYQYVTPGGRGTNDPAKAAQIPVMNPARDPDAENSEDNPWYMDAGTPPAPTSVLADAQKVPQENENWDPDDPNCYRYFEADGTTPTNDIDAARYSKVTYYKQLYTKSPSHPVTLDDNDLLGALQSERELLTECGEFSQKDTITGRGPTSDENAASKRGIQYYQKTLDLLANQFATQFNMANQGVLTDPDGNLVTQVWDAGKKKMVSGLVTIPPEGGAGSYQLSKKDMLSNREWDMSKVPAGAKQWLVDNGYKTDDGDADMMAYLKADHKLLDTDGNVVDGADIGEKAGDVMVRNAFIGGNLFSNNGDSDSDKDPPVTASNISISYEWSKGPMIVNSFTCPPGEFIPASTDSENILENMTSLFYKKLEYRPDTLTDGARSDSMFSGTFEEMWINIGTTLGDDMKTTTTLLDNYYEESISLDTSRDAVSGVDFNDEAMNLMMYAKSYNAACRLMTTIDSVLEKLINNTGVIT